MSCGEKNHYWHDHGSFDYLREPRLHDFIVNRRRVFQTNSILFLARRLTSLSLSHCGFLLLRNHLFRRDHIKQPSALLKRFNIYDIFWRTNPSVDTQRIMEAPKLGSVLKPRKEYKSRHQNCFDEKPHSPSLINPLNVLLFHHLFWNISTGTSKTSWVNLVAELFWLTGYFQPEHVWSQVLLRFRRECWYKR